MMNGINPNIPIIKLTQEEWDQMMKNPKHISPDKLQRMKLKVANKVAVKESPGKGLGVFATELIIEGEIIEECHLLFLPIPLNKPSDFLFDYRFLYPGKPPYESFVLPLGNGCIYNHSDNNNAFWRMHPRYKAFQFVAKTDIKPNEEICTYYGNDQYWAERNYINKK